MKIKKFNENLSDDPILLYNNKGDFKLGSFRINMRGKSGTIFIKDISDVNWDASIISYHNYLRGSSEWLKIHPRSLQKLSDEIKEICYKQDKIEEYTKFTFYIVDGCALLVHVNPEFKRLKEGGEITSYFDKLKY
jgi:hypothetical protein